MVYSSLAVLALSASAMVSPSTVPAHARNAQPDTRVTVTLHNSGVAFRDVKIGSHVYTIQPRQSIQVKAPAGTVVYADNAMLHYHRGDAIVEIAPEMNEQKVEIN